MKIGFWNKISIKSREGNLIFKIGFWDFGILEQNQYKIKKGFWDFGTKSV
jgi:hypothetical protein